MLRSRAAQRHTGAALTAPEAANQLPITIAIVLSTSVSVDSSLVPSGAVLFGPCFRTASRVPSYCRHRYLRAAISLSGLLDLTLEFPLLLIPACEDVFLVILRALNVLNSSQRSPVPTAIRYSPSHA
jgi:hypothetical protein